jgi:hypothetical protein
MKINATCLFLVIAACGPSSATVRTAQAANYDRAPPEMVWGAMTDVMRAHYDKFEVIDSDKGLIVSLWQRSGRGLESADEVALKGGQSSQPVSAGGMPVFASEGPPATQTQNVLYRRAMARVVETPRRHVVVDVQAALLRPGLARMLTWKHGDPEEPSFVQAQIDQLYVELYERLQPYVTP